MLSAQITDESLCMIGGYAYRDYQTIFRQLLVNDNNSNMINTKFHGIELKRLFQWEMQGSEMQGLYDWPTSGDFVLFTIILLCTNC